MMEKLEMLGQFKQLYGEKINPDISSIKYCQNDDDAYVEMLFQYVGEPHLINLDFITDFDEEEVGKLNANTFLFFDPTADIVDNAKRLMELDAYSLLNCIDYLFTPEAIEEILKKDI